MKRLGGLLGSLGLLLLPLPLCADPIAAPTPTATASAPVPCPHDQGCDPSCDLYALYVATGVKFPFDLYVRSGISFNAGSTNFDRALKTGLALEIGARSFCFDLDKSAAWFADVGMDYLYNRADAAKVIAIKFPNLEATQGSGAFAQTNLVPAREELGAYQFHRLLARLGGGREWYWAGDDPAAARCTFGVDGGIHVGSATARTRLIHRTFFDPTFQIDDGTTIGPTNDGRVSDLAKGFYLGASANVLIPRCGYECVLGIRAEYSHDVIGLPGTFNTDDALDQVQALVTIGIRY